MLITSFQWVFFAWSISLIEAAITTVIYEFWPVLFLLLRPITVRMWSADSEMSVIHKNKTTIGDVGLVLVAGVGLALTVLSEGQTESTEASLAESSLGIALAASALLLASLSTTAQITVGEVKIARQRVAAHLMSTSSAPPTHSSELIAKLYVTGVTTAIPKAAAGLATVAWGAFQVGVVKDPVSVTALAVGVLLGVLHAAGDMLFFSANHLSRSDTINSLYYGTPVLALVLLWALTEVEIGNTPMFLAGMSGVVVVNMALHLNPEDAGVQADSYTRTSGHGFKMLVITLWLSGSIVLTRDDWYPESMLAWAMPEYWALLAIGATVFILILSFRQGRLAERQREADRLVLSTYAEIETCHDMGLLSLDNSSSLIKSLYEIDTRRRVSEIGSAYLDFRKTAQGTVDTLSQAGRARLRAVLRDVEILTNLRQSGRNVVDLMVMALFAVMTIFVALFVRPHALGNDPQAWVGFVTELFQVAFSSAIGFLAFDLFDRSLERDKSLLRYLEHDDYPKGWCLNIESRRGISHRVFSGLLSGAVFAVFAVLLHNKWI